MAKAAVRKPFSDTVVVVRRDLDLAVVPLAGLQRGAARILLLAGAGTDPDVVDRPCPVIVGLVGLGGLVDLDLEARVHGEPGRVGSDARIVEACRRGLSRIAEAHEDARVVVSQVEAELEPQREVGEGRRGVEE